MLLYGVNGALNTGVTYGAYLLLIRVIDYRIASVLCFTLGVVISYILNRAVVFRRHGSRARFAAQAVAMLALNLTVTWSLVEAAGWPKSWAQLAAIGVVFFAGFWISRTFVFRGRGTGAIS